MKMGCVIATCGRKSVHRTIASLKNQTTPVEIIVIDDRSIPPVEIDDNDILVARNLQPMGLSVCRNQGIKMSSSDTVAFIDDDAFADSQWAEALMSSFGDGADIVGGLIEPVFEHETPRWLKESLYHLIAVNTPTHYIFGCNFAIRKKILEEMDYKFEKKLGRKKGNLVAGDETELFFKAREKGYKIKFNESAVVYHLIAKERLKFTYFIKRNFWEGRTEARRYRIRQHITGKTLWLLSKCYRLITHKKPSRGNMWEELEDIFINSLLMIPYIVGITFEYVIYRTSRV